MSGLVANSFPELAFLVMRETPSQGFFRLSELVELAISLDIDIRIQCSYPAFSDNWIEQLNGGMKRDSGINNAVNEGLPCLFSPQSSSCTEPWGLAFEPQPGESYAQYRRRNRGGGTRTRSAKSQEQAELFRATPPTLVCMLGEPLYVVTPDEGDGRHFICIFATAIEYRNENNVTHRDGDGYEQPAFFDWSTPSPTMRFCKHGKDHRLDGPALIFEDKSHDVFVVADEDCGSLGEPQTMKLFAAYFRRFTGQSLDPQLAEALRLGAYRDHAFFTDELAEAKTIHARFLGEAGEVGDTGT